MATAYSLTQAILIKKDFEYLIGLPFDTKEDSWLSVEDVAITPWDEINKSIFLEYYKIKKDAVAALRFYQNLHFDVIVISRGQGNSYCYKNLRTYCQELQISFSPKKYTEKAYSTMIYN